MRNIQVVLYLVLGQKYTMHYTLFRLNIFRIVEHAVSDYSLFYNLFIIL